MCSTISWHVKTDYDRWRKTNRHELIEWDARPRPYIHTAEEACGVYKSHHPSTAVEGFVLQRVVIWFSGKVIGTCPADPTRRDGQMQTRLSIKRNKRCREEKRCIVWRLRHTFVVGYYKTHGEVWWYKEKKKKRREEKERNRGNGTPSTRFCCSCSVRGCVQDACVYCFRYGTIPAVSDRETRVASEFCGVGGGRSRFRFFCLSHISGEIATRATVKLHPFNDRSLIN